MAKVLITGNKGFIGSHITEVQHISYDLKDGLDIRNPYYLDLIFEHNLPDIVIHLAALPGVLRSKLYPKDYISTNIEGTWNVVRMCEKYSSKLIHFSSSTVYGNVKPPVKENDGKNPISLYGITKLAGEHIVNASIIPTTIIRPFAVYGENQRKDQLISKWLSCIHESKPVPVYGDGESLRGYVYVGDVKKVIETLINREWSWEHEDFNIGGNEVIRLQEIISIFSRKFPEMKMDWKARQKEDVSQQYANGDKAEDLLGFTPDTVFMEKLEEIISG